MTKSWGRNGCVASIFKSLSIMDRSQGKNSKQEPEASPEAEAMKEILIIRVLSLFSYTTEYHLPRGGTTHIRLSPSISTSITT